MVVQSGFQGSRIVTLVTLVVVGQITSNFGGIFHFVIQAPNLVQILIRLYCFEKVRGPFDLTFGAP